MRAPRRFDLIGLDFGPATHVHAEVRARRGGGPWTPWTALHAATQPCWTGPADLFQVRFTGAARQLRARFVRASGAPRPAVRAARRAKGAKGAPPIIPRSEWGGDRLPPRVDPIYGVVQVGFVHHTVTANAYGPEDSAKIVFGICRYHRDHNGWNDIGYNFLVDKYGQIFEGRDGGVDLAVVGAQAQGYNSTSTGVSCLGDYTYASLPDAAVEAVARLLAWKLARHGVPVRGRVTVVSQGGETNRYRSGARVTLDRISGHRDGDATACPGATLYEQLDDIRDRADQVERSISALTIRTTETELTYPDTTFALAGTLRFADRADPTGAQVQIQYQPPTGAGWETIQAATADAQGAFAAEVTVPASGRVRAVFAGDGVHGALKASPIAVSVLPRLTLSADPRRVRVGSRTRLSGSVEPLGARHATLVVQRRVGSRYYLVKRRRVPVRDGLVSAGFRPRLAGLYRVTLKTRGAKVRRFVRAV